MTEESARAADSIWVMVLAGGSGTRFWPLSTPARPKQLLPLGSDRPLIVDTVERARAVAPDARIRILAASHLLEPFRTALPDLPHESYWTEPQARGTTPVLAWAAWRLARQDPEAIMVSLHSDHLIQPIEALRETVAAAVEVARRDDMLVCIGVRPDRVEPAFGHIELGDPLPRDGAPAAYRVRAFHEKPDPATAEQYVRDGQLWNTGIFVWRAAVLLEELARHAPEVSDLLPLIERSDEAFFDAVPPSVVDRAVMERSDRVATVRATFSWDDVGSWEALARTRAHDTTGNVLVGRVRTVDASDNVVFAETGEVVLFGTEGLVVVRTGDRTMVVPRSRLSELKAFLATLEGGLD